MQVLLKSAQVCPPNKPAPLSSSERNVTKASSCPQTSVWQMANSRSSLMTPFSSPINTGGKSVVPESVAPCGAKMVAVHCSGVLVQDPEIREEDVLTERVALASKNVTSSACRLKQPIEPTRQIPSNRRAPHLQEASRIDLTDA